MNKSVLIFIFIFFWFNISIFSQETGKKPVVALVLSGGTAKGLSHIGVIKVLEEEGIKPDIIIGTSMGSIIGGLYAMGYNAEQLREIALSTDWYSYLSNDRDLRNLNIEEKDDFEEFTYNFPIKDRKPEPGKGLIYGHELEMYLNKITYPTYKYDNFDQLPIKYRAITVDILNAEKYVFKDGPLSIAMRSSMSLPTIFIPKKYKGRLLVDGGIVDNFGVDEALKNGADIIIGSNVGRMNLDEEQLGSFPKIFWLVMMFQSKQNYDKYVDSVDVLIEPPVLDMGTRFDKAKQIIESGYNTASLYRDKLRKIKQRLDSFPENNKYPDVKIDRFQTYPVSSLEINGIKNNIDKYLIEYNLKKELMGHIAHSDIKKEIDLLMGSGLYSIITYYLEKEPYGKYKLIMNFEELPKSFLQLGIHYSDQVDFGIIAGVTSRNTIMPNSKFKIKGRISKYPGIEQYFVKYFWKKQRFGIKQNLSYIHDLIPFYQDDNKKTSFNRNFIKPGLSLVLLPGKNHMWQLGYNYQYYRYHNNFKIPIGKIMNASVRKHKFYLSYYHNSLDDKYFATQGNLIKINIGYDYISKATITDTSDIKTDIYNLNEFGSVPFLFQWDKYIRLNRKWILENNFLIKLDINDYDDLFFLNPTVVGGMFSDNENQIAFWGLQNNRYISSNNILWRTVLRYNITSKVNIRTAFNALVKDDGEFVMGTAIMTTVKTPLGPMNLGLGSSLNYFEPVLQINLGVFR